MSVDRRAFLVAGAALAGASTMSFSAAEAAEPVGGHATRRSPIELPEAVTSVFASRSHRLHHALWHGLRDLWNSGAISDKAKQAIGDLKWSPPRASIKWLAGGWMPETTNGCGVDFLYMHREMIAEFNKEMTKAGASPDIGWTVVPEPGSDSAIEVPPEWEMPVNLKFLQRRFAVVKSDDFYWSRLRWWDRSFHDHAYLRTLSLGQLGSLLETSIHNDMHMRWAETPTDPETGIQLPLGRGETDIDPKWDSPVYDFLGETYSSHVNPIFWRLHKWVDAIIDEWFLAHESHAPGAVKRIKANGLDWFESDQWIETRSPWSSPSSHAHHDVPTMEAVYHLLFPEPSRVMAVESMTSAPKTWFR